ncbi:MAG: gas vesicle protein [Vicingaceae bacterium]|jgi:gas vesicle protein
MDVKEKLNDWKSQAELFKQQLLLEKNEAEVAFEEKKEEMAEWLDDVRDDIKDWQKEGQEDLSKLKAKVEDLQVQLALKKADSLDQLKANQKKLNNGFRELKYELNKAMEDGKESLQKWAALTEDTIDQYHTRFDLFKVQLSFALEDGEEKLEEKQKELTQKIAEFKQKLEKLEDQGDLKWDNFKKEIGSAWEHVKKAF